jgi:hypothetical protein
MRVTMELNKPGCFSVFRDNAGVIDFDGRYAICLKVETHNYLSALEPYVGAATGNGSVNDIAGICDAAGRIFALMPHPERFIRWTQHPRCATEPGRDYGDGFRIFLNAVEWAKTI